MLQLYNLNKEKIEGLTKYKDLKIESTLSTGDKVLSFSYPKKFSNNILEEGYIRTKTAEFVIKQINKTDDPWISITASLNVEELENMIEEFDSTEQTIEDCINFALVGTGWTVNVDSSITKRRTVRKTNSSIWDIIQQVKKTYRVEIEFDTINKIVIVNEQIGSDKGTYFTEELNLKSLGIQSNSYDFYTRIIAIGKDDLKVEVENYSYSNKRKTLIWKDERYTDEDSLREDATLKLEEISKPYRSYSADVIDLANLNEKYKDILSYKLGDTITLISKDNRIREKQRIVKTVEYPDSPGNNTVEIANTTLSFEDVQKEFQDTSDTVNNITEDNGTVSEDAIKVAVEKLTINKINVGELDAVLIRVGTLEATKANITDLIAINARIENLQATKIDVTDLTATNIKFDVATGGTLDLQTLLSKFVTGENGQFLNLTTDNVTISNALIKDVIAKSISVEDLKVGNIDSNRFNIVGTDGNLLIKDNTIQIKDSARVRVQIGKDASGDYSMYVWDKQGNLMFDALGLKSSAIKDKIIRDDMVADNANINGSKLNISSLITEVNKDNTQTLKASRISFDSTGQSLEVSFNSLKSNVDNMEIGGRNLQGNADFNKPLSGTWRYDAQFMSINEEILCDGYKSVKVLRTNATTTSTRYLYTGAGVIPAKYNDEFTMSFMYYIPEDVSQEIDGTFQAGVWFYKDRNAGAGSTRKNLENEIVKGKWIKVVVTGKAKDVDTKSVAFVIGFDKNCEVYISKPKLERGNKATDFTVAPEDVEEKIESNTTAITVAQGQISGLISENTIIKGDITTISNKYTSLKATVDGINNTVASHTSSIGNLTTDLNGVSGKVTIVENKQTSLEQNLNGFKITVASTYSTKTELSTVDGKVTGLTSRVSTTESSITQLNNSIDLSVSNLKKIVQEGNNNLVSNSNWFKGPSGWRLSTTLAGNYFYGVSGSMALEDKHYIRLGHSNNNPTSSIYADSSKFPVSPGEKITYGAFGAATSNVRFRIYLLFTSNIDDINIDNSFMSGYTSILYEGNAAYTKKNLTVIVPDGAIRAFIRVRIDKIDTSINTNSSGVFSSLMVRKGEEVFEWCPSQGDSYTYIDEQTAKLQVNINDITSRVSSTESTISTINGNVSSLQTRMSSAEQKITSSVIINTVRSSTAYTNDLNAKANQSALNTTNSNISNLTTRVNSVEQNITATAITTTISSAITSGTGSISTTQFVMDNTGFTVKNGAIKILNNAGQIMLQGDGNGNLSFSGRLQPYDYQVKLFGNDCKIDGSAGAIRMQWNPQTYVSVEDPYIRTFNKYSSNGTNYGSMGVNSEGHFTIFGQRTMLKLLGNSSDTAIVQARWTSDTAYAAFAGSDFLNRSTIKDKTNIEPMEEINFNKILLENNIFKYNLKTDVESVLSKFGLEKEYNVDEIASSSADIKLGFILEELTEEAKMLLNPYDEEAISVYSMCSILWKVCQEQQKRIDVLEEAVKLFR